MDAGLWTIIGRWTRVTCMQVGTYGYGDGSDALGVRMLGEILVTCGCLQVWLLLPANLMFLMTVLERARVARSLSTL